MKKHVKNSFWNPRRLVRCAAGLALLAGTSGALADDLAAARFKGAPTYDLAVTNVKWEAGTKDYSWVTFDLSWGHSWRAKWVEPADKNVTGKPLEVENWDAAWIFVKFLPENDSSQSIERNHWLHATLGTESSDHVMPAGATNTVRQSEEGTRGIGVFIYRDAVGAGPVTFKKIKLRWQHGLDKVDPAKAAMAVLPIAMVYVAEGPFEVGAKVPTGFNMKFADGPDVPIARFDHEQAERKADGSFGIAQPGILTDGAWRGGLGIPFLVDVKWNQPAAEGSNARRIGPVAGQLWGTFTFTERMPSGSTVGGPGVLNDDYPTGYEPFYYMKYELTQGQYVDYLNLLPPDVAAGRAFVGSEVSADYGLDKYEATIDPGPKYAPFTRTEIGGLTIWSSADVTLSPRAGQDNEGGKDKEVDDLLGSNSSRPVYKARLPFRTCGGLNPVDAIAYTVWAGLRPLSELEIIKGCRGPLHQVPYENQTGSTNEIRSERATKDLTDKGLPTERYLKGNRAGGYGVPIGVIRVGSFFTPTSDRVSAGAAYWGGNAIGCITAPVVVRNFRATHGDGSAPAGTPDGSTRRSNAPFTLAPEDWPKGWGEMGVADRSWINTPYQGGQRLISVFAKAGASAKNKVRKPGAPAPVATAKPVAPTADPGLEARRVESIKVTNVKWEAGGSADQSVVTLDLAWDNSWRAKWEEPAEKNVTGKPLKLESWDAAWVFIKFRKPGDRDEEHATLSTDTAQHVKPAGAALDVGLSDDGGKGTGVFVYRAAVGSGANAFTGLKLRWLHGSDKVTDPSQVKINAYAIPMVYVPKGPFKSKSPWGYPLTLIDNTDPTKPGGYPKVGPGMTPESDSWPNGFMAYYCMKYPISQGQYAGFLNSVASDLKATTYNAQRYGAMAMENVRRFGSSLYNFNGYTITNVDGSYVADVPDRTCNFLSLFDIQSYMGWSGLRPLTSLEYEKACRGPREVAREEDAWTAADCVPAAELAKQASERLSPIGLKPSFWGIRGLSLSGCVQEWPAAVCQTEIPTPDQKKGACVGYKGSHGTGSPVVSEEWVWTFFGEWYNGGIWRCKGYGTVGHWLLLSELDRLPKFWAVIDGSRTGRYGALAGRTAPSAAAANAMLQIDPLPRMTGVDVGIFYLSGRVNNSSDKAVSGELTSPVPDVCFLDGAASRALTVASKDVKPFKIAMALTHQSVMNGGVRGGTLLPIRIQGKDGIVLEESLVPLQMTVSSPVISSIKGGEVALRITNTTDRALTLAVRLAPVGVTLTETNKSVTVAAGAEARAVFPVPIQGFASTGPCKIPYSIVVGTGAPQGGEAVVDLKTESRWWISKRVKGAPKSGAFDEGPDSGDDMVSALAGLSDLASYDGTIFKAAKPSKDWTPATYGANIAFGEAGKLPSHGSAMLAATRVEASADREAVLTVQHATKARFDVTVWVNDAMVFKKAGSNKNETKPFTLRKTGNTMMVECRSAEIGAVTPGTLSLQFSGAKDGQPINGLLFDMEKR